MMKMKMKYLMVLLPILAHVSGREVRGGVGQGVVRNSDGGQIRADGGVSGRQKRALVAGKSSLTEEERLEFVYAHNSFRNVTNPVASDMRKIFWNPVLEGMAQEWANRCQWGHGQPPGWDDNPFGELGQNNHAHTSYQYPAAIVNDWHNEVNDYEYETHKCNGVTCLHYTQVVWAETYNIGCGIAFCEKLSSLTNAYFTVCNYGPAGNLQGQRPYIKGNICSACGEGTTCEENSLCVDEQPCAHVECLNGGELHSNTCVCSCPPNSEFTGPICSGAEISTSSLIVTTATLLTVQLLAFHF